VGFSAEGEPTVAAIEPNRLLALHISSNVSWAFVLEEITERTTRLILRSRIDTKSTFQNLSVALRVAGTDRPTSRPDRPTAKRRCDANAQPSGFETRSKPRQLFALAYSLLVELPHFIMERKMLLGIKEWAESGQAARTANPS
jgi:hypothetical protein